LEKSSFFNSVSGDRKYQASDFAAFFSSLLTNGVFPNPSTNLQVLSNNNMTVTVGIGKAWINGYVYINDSALILPIAVADGVLNRIDRLVIQFDTVGRTIKTVVKKGVFSTTPVAPVLEQDANYFELAIADIYIGKGVLTVVQANITDQRMNTILCGWVNSLIQADTTAIFNQYQAWFTATTGTYNVDMAAKETQFQADFTTWFNTIKGQLAGDIAGNLAVSISNLAGTGRTTETVKQNALNIATNAADLVAHKADYVKHPGYAITTGSANTYIIATTPAPTVLVDGMGIIAKITTASTGASTLNWNSLGAIPILDSLGNAITSGGLKANTPYTMRYNGTSFIVQGKGGGGNLIASHLLVGDTGTGDSGVIIGTMPNLLADNVGVAVNGTLSPGRLYISPATGYWHGGIFTYWDDPNFIPSNIVSGKSPFGLVGTATALNPSVGDNITITDASTLSSTSTSFVLLSKKFTINLTGAIRFKFSAGTVSTNATQITARVYKNGVAFGILRTYSSGYLNEFTEDYTCNAGDYFQVYGYCSNTTDKIQVSRVKICVATVPIAQVTMI
jgi:hypothetical protein